MYIPQVFKQIDSKGISLIEVIITVGLFLIVGSALTRLGVTALTSSDNSRTRTAALQLADEGLEIARAVRDADQSGFFGLSDGNYEVNSTYDGFDSTNCDPLTLPFSPPVSNSCEVTAQLSGSNVSFYRTVRITDTVGVNNSKDVTAYVFWNNAGTYSNVTSGTVLTRWRN